MDNRMAVAVTVAPGGGQPPGSVMDFDPRTPVVVRCGSLSIGTRQWHFQCFNLSTANRYDSQWGCILER